MRISSSVAAYGYWGRPTPPAFNYTVASAEALKAAAKRPRAIVNLRVLRPDDERTRAIILDPRLTFPAAGNMQSDWTQPLGGPSFLLNGQVVNNGAAGDVGYVLQHENAASDSTEGSRYISSTYQILKNTPWSIRANISETGNTVFASNVWWLKWSQWQFMVIDKRAYLALCSATWNDADEFVLTALMGRDTLLPGQQETMDEIRASIYTIFENISLEPGGNGWYGTPFTLTFIPEPRGAVTVLLGEGANWQEQTVEVPSILNTRKSGTLWESGPLAVSSRGGTYVWQVGYPVFPATGVLRNGTFQNGYWADALGDMVLSSLGNSEETDPYLDGASIICTCEEINAVTSEIVTTFTSDATGRLTPFLYGLNALIEAGPRDGSTAQVFPPAEPVDLHPVKNIEPCLEGDMRRSQYTVTMRDISGRTLRTLGSRYEALENRTCDLTVGGLPVIRGGIVKSATLANMRRADENQNRDEVANAETEITLTICDQWAVLEETLLREGELIGDALTLGEFCRRALRCAGLTAAEMAGVSAAAGRVLPSGTPGEGYAIISSDGQTVANILRDTIGKWAMGMILYQSGATGVWMLEKRSTGIAQVGGQDAVFVSGGGHDPDTYPGRFAVLRPLDMTRDTDDFYNAFRVEGAMGADGRRIVAEWLTQESLTGAGNTQSRRFIGRLRRYPTVQDEGIRTQSDAAYAVRSLYELYGKPPRFHSFETYFHSGLFPGDRITLDGVALEIVRIGGSGIAADRMTICGREI